MIINNLYKTTIKTEDDYYNFQLGETANIQIILTDYNNKPVSRKTVNVTIKSEKGTEYLNNNYTTNKNGTIAIPYVHEVPEVLVVSCNNKTIRLLYDGWCEVPQSEWQDTSTTIPSGLQIRMYYNLQYIRIYINGSVSITGQTTTVLAKIVNKYTPITRVTVRLPYGYKYYLSCRGNGEIDLRHTSSGSFTPTFSTEIAYPRTRF